jgi:hypothetical protein
MVRTVSSGNKSLTQPVAQESAMEEWSILIDKEYLKFSCAHFMIFPDGTKERLHGHNYHVTCEIDGQLSEHGLVIDFRTCPNPGRR